MDVCGKTLKTIEENKITPQPRWHFLLKDYFFIGSFFLSIIVGAAATSAVIFMLTETDWDVYKYLDRGLLEHIVVSMPYLWISVLLLFTFLAYYNFKCTRRGYRYEIRLIILCSISASLFLGLLLFWSGLGDRIHQVFMKEVPFYNDFIHDPSSEP